MSRTPQIVRKRDLETALRAAAAAGLTVVQIEIGKDGRLVLTTSDGPSACKATANEWDEVLKQRGPIK